MRTDNHNNSPDNPSVRTRISKTSSNKAAHPDNTSSKHPPDHTNRITTLVNQAANRGESFQSIIKLVNKETRKAFSGNGSAVYLLDEDKEYLLSFY